MLNFEYYIPTRVYFGKGQIENLKRIKEYSDNVLMVYGGGSIKKNGIYDEAMAILKENDIAVTEISGVQANPRIELVREGAALCKEHGITAVLGIGAGSVLDSAKAIAAAALYDGDAWDLVKDGSKIEEALPIFTVLTMAATGSEMDFFAVISDMNLNDKLGTCNEKLFPTFSILDPQYTYTVPRRQLVAGTADIMSHVIDTYFNKYDGASIQQSLGEALLVNCIKYLPVALKKPEDYEARANLMWASSLAINGLLKCGCATVWSCHKMEHELSAYFDVIHGEGLAVLTPVWMEYVLSEETADRFARYAVNVWGIPYEGDKMVLARNGIDRTREFFKEMGLPQTLKEIGVREDKLEVMAEKAASYLATAYVPMDKDDVLAIFQKAYE